MDALKILVVDDESRMRKLVSDFLKLGSVDECDAFVEEYFAAIGEHNYQSLLLRQYMTMDIFY